MISPRLPLWGSGKVEHGNTPLCENKVEHCCSAGDVAVSLNQTVLNFYTGGKLTPDSMHIADPDAALLPGPIPGR
jgi:hypothetical protein